MATLHVKKTLMGDSGEIEDVVADGYHRRRGLGEKVVRETVEFAKSLHLPYIELSSNRNRQAANALYRKLGFEEQNKERNFYLLELA